MLSAHQRFHNTVVEFLSNISSCVSDLNDEGFTEVEAQSVTKVEEIMKRFAHEIVIKSFVKERSSWDKIMNRDIDFVTKDVPVVYAYVGEEIVKAIILPFKAHAESKVEGKDCPITDSDIDILWQFFASMVSISCNYMVSQGRNNYPDFDLDAFCSKHNINIVEVTK